MTRAPRRALCLAALALVGPAVAGELLGRDVYESMIASRQAQQAKDAKAQREADEQPTDADALMHMLAAAKAERRDLVLNGKLVPLELQVRISQLEAELADTKYYPTYR